MDIVRNNGASLVELKPDVILSASDRTTQVLRGLTRSIPIVTALSSDPVGLGLADSLARPGGNVTGFSVLESSIVGKMLEALKQIAPGVSHIGIIFNPDNPFAGPSYLRAFETSASQLDVQAINLPVRGLGDIEHAIGTLTLQPNSGIIFPPDVTTNTFRMRIFALVAQHRLPAIYSDPTYVTVGGLIAYGPDRTDLFRRAAFYAHRILSGERPGDLPFQLPAKYGLAINISTAKALGLTIPETLLATADEVIQ
jgi:putative ABC transport system substrate-binding protein